MKLLFLILLTIASISALSLRENAPEAEALPPPEEEEPLPPKHLNEQQLPRHSSVRNPRLQPLQSKSRLRPSLRQIVDSNPLLRDVGRLQRHKRDHGNAGNESVPRLALRHWSRSHLSAQMWKI